MTQVLRGTAAQLAGRLTINGIALSQPEISMLTRVGNGIFCNPVETIRSEGRGGKPATVWEFEQEGSFDLRLKRKAVPKVAEGSNEHKTASEAVATSDDLSPEVRAEIDQAVSAIIKKAKGTTGKRGPKAK